MGLFKKRKPPESNDPERPPKGPASVSKKDDNEKSESPSIRVTTIHEIWGTR